MSKSYEQNIDGLTQRLKQLATIIDQKVCFFWVFFFGSFEYQYPNNSNNWLQLIIDQKVCLFRVSVSEYQYLFLLSISTWLTDSFSDTLKTKLSIVASQRNCYCWYYYLVISEYYFALTVLLSFQNSFKDISLDHAVTVIIIVITICSYWFLYSSTNVALSTERNWI